MANITVLPIAVLSELPKTELLRMIYFSVLPCLRSVRCSKSYLKALLVIANTELLRCQYDRKELETAKWGEAVSEIHCSLMALRTGECLY